MILKIYANNVLVNIKRRLIVFIVSRFILIPVMMANSGFCVILVGGGCIANVLTMIITISRISNASNARRINPSKIPPRLLKN